MTASLPSCHLPGAVAGHCVPVDVAGTAGRWVVWDVVAGAPVSGTPTTWPVVSGGPVPGLDPRYRYLLTTHEDPPEHNPITHRVARRGAGHGIPDLEAGTLDLGWELIEIPLAEQRARMRCTPRQARLALLAAGLLEVVEAWMAAAPPAVRIEWEYALEIRRDWPGMTDAASALGLTDAQLDALFVAAAGYP